MILYVFGPGRIGFEAFLELYLPPLQRLEESDHVVVCDLGGTDTLAMEVLKDRTANVAVLHIGERPRYLPDRHKTKAAGWELVGGFADDNARDRAAVERCTHFLAHDLSPVPGRTSGTMRIMQLCHKLGKPRIRCGSSV